MIRFFHKLSVQFPSISTRIKLAGPMVVLSAFKETTDAVQDRYSILHFYHQGHTGPLFLHRCYHLILPLILLCALLGSGIN